MDEYVQYLRYLNDIKENIELREAILLGLAVFNFYASSRKVPTSKVSNRDKKILVVSGLLTIDAVVSPFIFANRSLLEARGVPYDLEIGLAYSGNLYLLAKYVRNILYNIRANYFMK